MLSARHRPLPLTVILALGLLGACNRSATAPSVYRPEAPTIPPARYVHKAGNGPSVSPADVTGERTFGEDVIEPGYDAATGALIFMLTPDKAPFPTHSNSHAVAPLWMVVYPPNSSVASSTDYHLSCEGVPGNCPDHAGLIAGIATRGESAVYGSDSTAVPGHDHVFAAPGSGGDFNIAWELNVVLFTPQGAADGAIDQHLTTEAAIESAVKAGDARVIDLGASIVCTVVSPTTYAKATPVG